MGSVYAFGGKQPTVGNGVFIAPSATLIGDVLIEDEVSIWFGAVVRADFERIVVGRGSCIQDNAVVHCAPDLPTIIGSNATIGHSALLEGCSIGDGALVGMGAIVLQGGRVGAGSVVAAGSVVVEGQLIPGGVVATGAPAVVKKPVSGSSRRWVETAAAEYQALQRRYAARLEQIKPE